MAAETAGEALASDFGIGELVDLAHHALRLRFARRDHRAEAGKDQHVLGGASFFGCEPF